MGETMREVCVRVGLIRLQEEYKIAFDYAYPIEWAREVERVTGIFPRGLVWLYDKDGLLGPKCGIFGRAYPVTMYAWQVLRIYDVIKNIGGI